jgi:hypothetical protein
MLNRYDDFILESLILESKFSFSDRFQKVLGYMPSNTIKQTLIDLKNSQTDLPVAQNYIDITDNKEEVTFIPDRRAQQIISENPTVFRTNSYLPGSKFLTFNKDQNGDFKNQTIFSMLGFTPVEPINQNHPVPGPGVEGEIVSKAVGPRSGRTYFLFKWNQGGVDKLICLNEDAVDKVDSTNNKLYSQSRNPIRIGRLVNSIMSVAKVQITPREVEEFTNLWKSAWDMMNDAFMKFDVVSGYAIAKWYNESSYESDDSTLGSSCMRYDECENYFGIYADNSDVCKLVILYSDKGSSVKDGKFIGSYIKGRALLWKTNQGDMFMDRIYTNYDSDVELFKQFAEKNGWWCKRTQNSSNDFTAQRGSSFKDPTYSVDLKWAQQEFYPYVDTLSYLKINEINPTDPSGILSNDPDLINPQYELRDTEGDRNSY